MVISGWRAGVVLAVGLVLACLLVFALFWVGVLLVACGVVAWFNLMLLPRVARRLRVPEMALAIGLLPLLGIVGFVVGAVSGLAAGIAIWAIGVALPRGLVRYLRRRRLAQESANASLGQVRIIDADFHV